MTMCQWPLHGLPLHCPLRHPLKELLHFLNQLQLDLAHLPHHRLHQFLFHWGHHHLRPSHRQNQRGLPRYLRPLLCTQPQGHNQLATEPALSGHWTSHRRVYQWKPQYFVSSSCHSYFVSSTGQHFICRTFCHIHGIVTHLPLHNIYNLVIDRPGLSGLGSVD